MRRLSPGPPEFRERAAVPGDRRPGNRGKSAPSYSHAGSRGHRIGVHERFGGKEET